MSTFVQQHRYIYDDALTERFFCSLFVIHTKGNVKANRYEKESSTNTSFHHGLPLVLIILIIKYQISLELKKYPVCRDTSRKINLHRLSYLRSHSIVFTFNVRKPLRIEPVHVTFVTMFSVRYKTTQWYIGFLLCESRNEKTIHLLHCKSFISFSCKFK